MNQTYPIRPIQRLMDPHLASWTKTSPQKNTLNHTQMKKPLQTQAFKKKKKTTGKKIKI